MRLVYRTEYRNTFFLGKGGGGGGGGAGAGGAYYNFWAGEGR